MNLKRVIATILICCLGPSPLVAQSGGFGGLGVGGDPSGTIDRDEVTDEVASQEFETRPKLAPFEPSESNLSPAIEALLDSAESKLGNDPAAASASIIALLMSPDPISKAQHGLYAERAADILRRAAAALDDSKQALIAGDAAWVASGRTQDPVQAERLVVTAQNTDSEAESLWLVRRALLADPNNNEAAKLEEDLSTNPLETLGWSMFFGGLGLIVAGVVVGVVGSSVDSELKGEVHTRADADSLIAQRDALAVTSYASYGVGLLSFIASGFVLSMGSRDYRPVSPSYLPALEDRR